MGELVAHASSVRGVPDLDEQPGDAYAGPEKQLALPQDPYTVYGPAKKRTIILLAAVAGFFSPLNSNIYFRASSHIKGR